MRRYALLLAFTAGLAFAAAPPPAPPAASDELGFLFLAGDRPVRIAMHLRSGDRPYQAGFDDWAKKFFAWFDKDGSGSLSPAEGARLLETNFLSTIARGGISGGRFGSVPFANLDRDKDGKVSYAEFLGYLRTASLGDFTFSMSEAGAQSAGKTNDALWRLLDADKDGRLTKEEVARLPDLMTKLDENEDEFVTEDEISPETSNPFGRVAFSPDGRMAAANGSPLLSREQPSGALGATALRVYDRNKDGKLTREEIGLDAKAFAALDADGKGYLDAKKLEKLFDLPADLTFKGVIGALPRVAGIFDTFGLGPKRLTLLTPGAPLAKSVKAVAGDAAEAKFGISWLAVTASSESSGRFGRFNQIKQFYEQQFDAAAGDKKEPLTREQVMANQFLGSLFSAADANADGKLARKELSDFLTLIEGAQGTVVTAQCEDQGQSLFKALDGAGGSRLSLRHLRTAWQRLGPLCKDGKHLTREDLPRRVTMALGEGQFFNNRVAFVTGVTVMAVGPGGMPLWFRRMDRNTDGDVSPREWLGTEEDFKRLDADGDGLISPEEARKAEAKK